jgi:hypothetical protein
MGLLLVGALALQAQHAALGHQRLDAGDAELGRLLDQPVHAVVGRHADRQMDGARRLALERLVGADLDLDAAAAHLAHGGVAFAAAHRVAEQRDAVAGLQPQHLDMAGALGREFELQAGLQGLGLVDARHGGAFQTRP